MPSPDRSKRRTPHGLRGGARAARRGASGARPAVVPEDALSEGAATFDFNEPWDAASAEALTRLYESEEGDLSRPAARVHPPQEAAQCRRSKEEAAGAATAGAATAGPAAAGPQAVDRMWLEAHLARLSRRLQRSLARSSPDRSLSVLADRLDAIEQRFGTALGRVAQRADLESLKSIEAHVMELGTQLERAHERLEQISAVDDEVCALARRLDEAGERRAAALEKLLRDCIAEWREGEQRTASALQNLEEAISRLGDSVDAMEASKPAPDLTMPALAAAPGLDLSGASLGAVSPARTAGDLAPSAPLYHTMLDAADYAPKATNGVPADEPALSAKAAQSSLLPAAAVEWSGRAADLDFGERDGAGLTAGAWDVAALRARLREAEPDMRSEPAELVAEAQRPIHDTFRRASLGLLVMAGAVLASSTYMLYQAVVAPFPAAAPTGREPGAQAVGGKPELTGSPRHSYGEG